MNPLQAGTTFVTRIFKDVERKHLLLIAAGLAYYFMMSLVPALVVLTAVVAYLPLKEHLQDLMMFLGYVTTPQAVSLFTQLLDSIRPHRIGLLSFGILVALWASSLGIKGIIAGLDLVHEVGVPRHLWTNKILAFGLTLGVGFLLLLGLTLTLGATCRSPAF